MDTASETTNRCEGRVDVTRLRIGHGYDVHAFGENRDLVLGGVRIPYELGLVGHSDADVVAHALADAVLSAARLGDIGKLFPDTDPAYAGADSIELLSQVTRLVKEHGFSVLDADITVAAQEPKLSPYRDDMRRRLAGALDVDVGRVGVKATTTEGLGFVGRREGIAAWAVVLMGDGRC